MKLFIFAILWMVAIWLWLWGIADWRTIELPKPTRMLIVPIQLHLDDTDKVYIGELLWEFQLSRYYTPDKAQTELLPYEKNKQQAIETNCWKTIEDCKHSANGYELKQEDAGKIYSCPPEIPMNSKIKLVFHRGTMFWECKDRGGDIKDKRLDGFCWIGNTGVRNIKWNKGCFTWKATIYLLQW